jgi:sporulation protein YlmC with PRC-barrel domain
MMLEIKNSAISSKETIDLLKIIGKKAYAKDSKVIGRIAAVLVHPRYLSVQGIVIRDGIFSSDAYIGKDFIEHLDAGGALLSLMPDEFIGKRIYDRDGIRIGTVKGVRRASKRENFSIVADRGAGMDELIITERSILEIGDNVLLKERLASTEA